MPMSVDPGMEPVDPHSKEALQLLALEMSIAEQVLSPRRTDLGRGIRSNRECPSPGKAEKDMEGDLAINPPRQRP